ncbi:MAG: DUF1844 domain-containing protein [Phycisphaeraceae bacterium]
MTQPDDSPILHVDDDWKAQAQAEKQKLAEKEKAAKQQQAAAGAGQAAQKGTPAGKARPGQLPPAGFNTLINSIATQALFAMGAMPDPQTGQRYTNLDIARHHVDSLGVLEEKTKGNLTDEEQRTLATTLYELRSTYVQIANASRSPATGGPVE